MKVVFSNRPKNIGSILIRLFTRKRGQKLIEIPSHVSIVLYDSIIIEAVMGHGVRFNYLPTFLKSSKVLAEYQFNNQAKDFVFYRQIANVFHGKPYDYTGILWFAWVLIKSKLLGKDAGKYNRFESKKRAFCNEILSIIMNEETSHVSPNEQMLQMETDTRFTKVTNA